MKKCMHKIENMPLQPSSIFAICFFSSKTLCVVIFREETACMWKAWEWPRGWQMPGPRAVQNLQMPDPRDWQGGQIPPSSPGGRGWAQLELTDAVQFLRFAVGLLVEPSLVSLIVVFDFWSLSTKWASHRKQIVWDSFRQWRILLCSYINPYMLLNQVCHVCVRFGECWHGKRWNDAGETATISETDFSPCNPQANCFSNRVKLRDKGERSDKFTFERWSWLSWRIVEWTRTLKYGQDRDRESKLRKRICWYREHRRKKRTQVNGER